MLRSLTERRTAKKFTSAKMRIIRNSSQDIAAPTPYSKLPVKVRS
ncbi:hypothetical protein [Micromonospora zhanjiangensis]